MRRIYAAWTLVAAAGVMDCSPRLEKAAAFTLGPDSQVIVFPFMFQGYNIAVLQTTKYGDLKGNARRRVASFLEHNISHAVWYFVVGGIAYKDDRSERLFSEMMDGYLKKISAGASKVYMGGHMMFSELLETVHEMIFECNKAGDSHVVKYGESIINRFSDMIENAPTGISAEEKRECRRFWSRVKERAGFLYSTERLRRVVEAEKIVCNACKEICLELEEEELMGLLAEGGVRKALKAKVDEDEISRGLYLECTVVNTSLLLDAHREHGGDVTRELVKQMLLGKKGEEIDRRYINKVANVVKERQRREMEKRDWEQDPERRRRRARRVGSL
ncbi:putative cytochrome P450-like protein [Encephalitozoon cuniculi]|nr:DUF3654 domain-containing protein [Encephalitozoon cuniculi]UYI26922.1 cytochrome P450-like protein [Encephalitozoon cuniculi]UYI27139.1 DUF3654 domain-containing protein [Encephalitozoon cuniculi]UYI27562.1 putative cytochrome-like protein [Encephalitozoon cuniculi]UYI27967.1 putative cytochrome P450-like protein [Encephalitozoon cuniculi]